jgi:DNA repair protein RadA/Sms
MESRLKEAAKLGFGAAVMPRRRQRGERGETEIARREISHLGDLVALFETDSAGQSDRARRPARPTPVKGAR